MSLEYIVATLGYIVSGHVMARLSLSSSRTCDEENLTADVIDLFSRFDVAKAFCNAYTFPRTVDITPFAVNRRVESKVGADFVLVFAGPRITDNSARVVLKVAAFQAKKVDENRNGRYMTSTNHVRHATNMISGFGPDASFFAWYHNEQAMPHGLRKFTYPLSPTRRLSSPPWLWYATPYNGPGYFFAHHPALHIPTFISPSAHIDHILRLRSKRVLPDEYSWGIAVTRADVLLNMAVNQPRDELPSVSDILSVSSPFPEFLVHFADCRVGRILDGVEELSQWLRNVSELGEDTGFRPSGIVSVTDPELTNSVVDVISTSLPSVRIEQLDDRGSFE